MVLFLDIVFQSGEFNNPDNSFCYDVLIGFISACFGFVSAYFALRITFNNDRKKEDKKHEKLQKEKILYFKALVINVIKTIKAQIAHIVAFSDTLKNNPLEMPLLTEMTENDVERLVNRINQEEYFHSYIGIFTINSNVFEEFRNLYANLDFFDKSIKLLHESNKKAHEDDLERKLLSND
jgi:hypothetical protein